MTSPRRRGLTGLAVAGLLSGGLVGAAGPPAVAAEGGEILIYTGDNALNQGYSNFSAAVGLPRVESPSLPEELSDFACIVLPVNQTSFSAETTEALVAYVVNGGNLLAAADHVRIVPRAIATMNKLSDAIGASMSLTSQFLGAGDDVTEEIDPSPLTEGVATVGYGWATGVAIDPTGDARSLLRTNPSTDPASTTFMAAERIGAGTFVLVGDSNALSDTSPTRYATYDNGVLAKNLCLGSLVEFSIDGFLRPVAKSVVTAVKGGSTVPLKFRVFKGDTEITDPAVVESLTLLRVSCPGQDIPGDQVEAAIAGPTGLRYADGAFQQNWKTPKTRGCYEVTVATTDGTRLTADFLVR